MIGLMTGLRFKAFCFALLAVALLVFSLSASAQEPQAQGGGVDGDGVEAQLFQATGCALPLQCVPLNVVGQQISYCKRVDLSCGDPALACVQCVQELNVTRVAYLLKQVAKGNATALAELRVLINQVREAKAAGRQAFIENFFIKTRLAASANATAFDSLGRALRVRRAALFSLLQENGLQLVEIPVELPNGAVLKSFRDPETGVSLENGKLVIPMREGNNIVGGIIADVDAGKANASANGNVIMRIKQARLAFREKMALFDDKFFAASVNARLKRITENASASIDLKKVLGEKTRAKFEALAKQKRFSLRELSAVIEIKKAGLRDKNEIDDAEIVFRVPMSWVRAQGGVNNVRVLREADDGSVEELETRLIKTGLFGNAVFSAVSPNGLSVFAVYSVQFLKPESGSVTQARPSIEASASPPAEEKRVVATRFEEIWFIAVVLVIVGIAAFFYSRKKKT